MTNSENNNINDYPAIPVSIAPWLSVSHGMKAVEFYKSAFGAIEVYHLDAPDGGLVSKLSIEGAEFWLSGASADDGSLPMNTPQESSIRMILTVTNPDAIFARALEAGASQIFPVTEDYGWRLGRLADPFGHHWEVGHPLIK